VEARLKERESEMIKPDLSNHQATGLSYLSGTFRDLALDSEMAQGTKEANYDDT